MDRDASKDTSTPQRGSGGDSNAPASSRPEPLHYANVLDTLARSLGLQSSASTGNRNTSSNEPASSSSGSSGGPVLRNQADVVAATLHSAMVALGFRLVGLGEEGNLAESEENTLPSGWNASDSYAFRYRHSQSAMTYLIKAVRMADRMLVHGLALEDGKLRSTELRFDTYLGPSSQLPLSPPLPTPAPGADSPLLSLFRSAKDLQDMVNLFKIDVVQRIMPGLQKEGYEETATEPPRAASSSSTAPRPAPVPQPLGGIPDTGPMYPRRPGYGGPQPYGGGYGPPGGFGGGLGSRDLDPFGGAGYPGPGGLRLPGSGGIGGIGPSLPGPGGGGGMFMGPNDPIFGRIRDPYGGGGVPYPEPGPLAGPGGQRLPPGAVPPGARFDPIVPGPPPETAGGSGGAGFPGPGRTLGGTSGSGMGAGPGPGRTFPGEPDNDLEPPPPGYEDMFM